MHFTNETREGLSSLVDFTNETREGLSSLVDFTNETREGLSSLVGFTKDSILWWYLWFYMLYLSINKCITQNLYHLAIHNHACI